jgi:hypothetical protein
MSVKEYIESGAIEACIMGVADDKDLALLASMEEQYPEVKKARMEFEYQIENQSPRLVFPNPEATKRKIMEALLLEMMETKPIANGQPAVFETDDSVPKKLAALKWLRIGMAASFLLLLGSALLNFYFYSRFQGESLKYNELLVQQNALLQKKNTLEATLGLLQNPAVREVKLPLITDANTAAATVYWHGESNDVYFLQNNLQAPAAGKQYQLWAQVEGKMVDAGMITWNADGGQLVKMHNMPRAEAFAISLENEGGSPTPTLSAVVALGKI